MISSTAAPLAKLLNVPREELGKPQHYIVWDDGEVCFVHGGFRCIGEDPRHWKHGAIGNAGWTGQIDTVYQPLVKDLPESFGLKLSNFLKEHRFPHSWFGGWAFAEVRTKEEALQIRAALAEDFKALGLPVILEP